MNLDVDPLPGTIPQSGFPNGQYYNAASHMPTTHLSSSAMHGNGTPDTTTAHPEVTAHLEQLRNDLFTAATNISALSDRLERLENRPLAQTDLQPQIAALRADIERWICHHLETAVEQSMRRIWERHETASQPATAPVVA